ncbi:PREDICTED: growth/differentiation factor 9 [Nanorana parkeri]|uniref:growth/differentiation factor 9 n=1 Tax=Nanorana parkeri TaxID=125878 RepID=UPI000854A6A1|nr:PREDICTED: growth/differentiation factor 9 [Nanorana parkeri]
MAVSLFVCVYYWTWLAYSSTSASRLVYDSQAYSLLPPLLKELSERPGWGEGTLVPQSVAIKYMKKLYKMLATKEGVPRAHKNTEYNTVRFFTPKTECKARSREEIKNVKTLDLLFNIDSVSTMEQHLRSALVYSVSKQYSSSNISCNCSLEFVDQETTSSVCSRPLYVSEFQLQRKQRWIEIDVTAFLQPFLLNRQNIHLLFNLTCMRNKVPYSFGMGEPLRRARSPPCLLLYLNDTSNTAYHWRKLHIGSPSWHQSGHVISYLGDFMENVQMYKVPRRRRGQNAEVGRLTVESSAYNFSDLAKQFVYHQNECELHKFRLSFSQLNWDKWILAPHRYSPDYCKGVCPRLVGHRYGSPVHTMVQNIIYEKLDSSIPRPSCVPSEYRPMSVLIVETDKSIAYKEYQDMIATECTCR